MREEFPDAIIMRPADIFGPEDRFFNYYARPWRKMATYMPLWKSGDQTIKQPIYVSHASIITFLSCALFDERKRLL